MLLRLLILAVANLCCSRVLFAVEQVNVLALFPHKAMVSVDGKSRVLSEGMTSKEGVTLIEATPYHAILEWDGERRTLDLHAGINASYQTAKRPQVRIVRDSSGSYNVQGSINGKSVRFLVDTGANITAMSEKKARELGIRYRDKPASVRVQTASAVTKGYRVTLDRVRLGTLEERNVECVVIEGEHPPMVLLGMSFLDRVEMQNEYGALILQRKY